MNEKPKKLDQHKSLVNDISISSHGTLIASASSDHTVRIWSNTEYYMI
jgi:WD40 repeat protein